MPDAGMRTCSIDGCERVHRARGWCAAHYWHWKRYGDPFGGKTHETYGIGTEARFWLKVDRSDECWVWTSAINAKGYGMFYAAPKKYMLAHRFAYELLIGPIGTLEIDHTCHNRSCVRPEHLRTVTRKQNLENRAGPQSTSTSGVRGVSWVAKRQKWEAHATHHRKTHHLGYFTDKEDATQAAINGRNRLHTHNDLDRV